MSMYRTEDPFDDAILAADEADDAPIEEWTLDEFDRFADLRSAGAAWTTGDERLGF